jgi:hypothetical protein
VILNRSFAKEKEYNALLETVQIVIYVINWQKKIHRPKFMFEHFVEVKTWEL